MAASVPGSRREMERGGEAHRTQHPQPVLGKSGDRIADRPHQAALQVRLTFDVIDHAVVQRIEEHAVDRKVAPQGVLLSVAKRDLVRTPPVAVAHVAAKCSDFDLPGAGRAEDRDHAERLADGQRLAASEDTADLLRRGVGRDVVVLGRQSQQLVAHAPAGPQRGESRFAQAADHLDGELPSDLRIERGHEVHGPQVPNSGRRRPSCDCRRWTMLLCIWLTRLSLKSSVAPISFIVSSS